MNKTELILSELEYLIDEEKRIILPRFFKTGKGEYGEGDQFLGVTVPRIRSVASVHLDTSTHDIEILLSSPWHEVRMCGLMIMVENCKKIGKKSWLKSHSLDDGEQIRKHYFDLYLKHTDRINNWDMVDLTAPTIIGEYLSRQENRTADKQVTKDFLFSLAESSLLWEQRIAVVSTFTFIRQNEFDYIYLLAEKLLHHPHDLMQKAIGWMLREAGKRDKPMLMDFLDDHYAEMPRTMLRYAIEKFSDTEREYYMRKDKSK